MNVRPKVSMLAEKDVRLVHEASLEILEKTGVLYENKKALDIMDKQGADITGLQGGKHLSWVIKDGKIIDRDRGDEMLEFQQAAE